MRLIKRYDTELKAWIVGYWERTRFIVIDVVPMLEDACRIYDEEAA
jgi:hypothetical protein